MCELKGRSLLVAIAVSLTSTALGQNGPVQVNLTEPDAYAMRIMTVTRVGDGAVPSLLSVDAFDSESQRFSFSKAGGGHVDLRLSEIERIDFRRELRKANPVAQEASWTIEAQPGKTVTIDVPVKAFKIDAGQLVVADPQVVAPGASGQWEVNRVTYRSRRRRFRIELQSVTYTKKMIGGGRSDPSGSRKGLQ